MNPAVLVRQHPVCIYQDEYVCSQGDNQQGGGSGGDSSPTPYPGKSCRTDIGNMTVGGKGEEDLQVNATAQLLENVLMKPTCESMCVNDEFVGKLSGKNCTAYEFAWKVLLYTS